MSINIKYDTIPDIRVDFRPDIKPGNGGSINLDGRVDFAPYASLDIIPYVVFYVFHSLLSPILLLILRLI